MKERNSDSAPPKSQTKTLVAHSGRQATSFSPGFMFSIIH